MIDLLLVWIGREDSAGIRRVSQSQVGIEAYTRVPAYATVRLYTKRRHSSERDNAELAGIEPVSKNQNDFSKCFEVPHGESLEINPFGLNSGA